MREILFRGKRIDNDEWVEGFYVHLVDSRKNCGTHRIYLRSAETDCGDYYPDWYAIDPETVGQFTGLTDKNGKKIFEGDIIKFSINNSNAEIGKIIFVRGAFQFERIELPEDFDEYEDSERWTFDDDKIVMLEDNCEVIGNIYDNP